MTKEMETRDGVSEPVEILPEGIGEMPALEVAPILERAALHTETLGWGGEFGQGLRENLRGAAAWIKANGAKDTLVVVTTAAFVAASISAVAKGPDTPIIPSETSPRVMEVSPAVASSEISIPTIDVKAGQNWSNSLLKSLGIGFFKRNSSSIWYTQPGSVDQFPVLVDISSKGVLFQDGPLGEGGKDTVHYVRSGNLYVLPDKELAAVTFNEHQIFTFSKLNGTWSQKIGNEVIANYVPTGKNGMKDVTVWRDMGNGEFREVDSGWGVDASGNLVDLQSLSSSNVK